MDRIVVDSSVVVKWFVVEPYSPEAHRILDDYKAKTLTLFAPDLLNAEVGNVIWKKQRFQGLAVEDAHQIIAEFRKLKFAWVSSAALLDQAYRLAVAHQRTVYDALYMALSVREQCPYVTADERLYNAMRETFANVMWVADWPQSSEDRAYQ
jgi:predicted nucleic acid-binding protein